MRGAIVLETPRLRLIAPDAAIEGAALRGSAELGRALDAEVPPQWPPPHTGDVQGWWREALLQEPSLQGWTAWYWLWMEEREKPLLCGYGGFKGGPQDGEVEIGYSLIEPLHRRGLAPEGCAALIVWASRDARVRRVIAHAFPDVRASLRVLEKLGFREAGRGSEPGTLRFELELG
jgi:[ribosomal protein S5]-alanine N-acetyltransferase